MHEEIPAKTKTYLRWNQLIWWASFVTAFVSYGASVYSEHGEDSGFAKFFPLSLAALTLCLCLAAIHWAYSVNPLYAKVARTLPGPVKDGRARALVLFWSVVSAVTRIATLALLIFIYYEHWKDVQVGWRDCFVELVVNGAFLKTLLPPGSFQ